MGKFILKFLVVLSVVKFSSSESKNCTCVPFYQCSDDYTISTDGSGLIQIRNDEKCSGYLNICCTLPSPSPEIPTKSPKGCGSQNHEAFAWTASLLFKQYPNFVPSYKCRVSLIHEKIALTAAHCLQEQGYYQIKIGSTLRTVAQIVVHPSYKAATLHNDIALLLLNKSLKMDKVGTVCIPPPETVLDGSICKTATAKEKGGNVKVIDLPVVAKETCVEKLRKTHLGKFFQLHQGFLCAGGGLEDTCGGDGGSPLICPILGVPGRFQQVGIVSWGIGCGGDVPGVYVNLASFREWIDEVVMKLGLDINSYRV